MATKNEFMPAGGKGAPAAAGAAARPPQPALASARLVLHMHTVAVAPGSMCAHQLQLAAPRRAPVLSSPLPADPQLAQSPLPMTGAWFSNVNSGELPRTEGCRRCVLSPRQEEVLAGLCQLPLHPSVPASYLPTANSAAHVTCRCHHHPRRCDEDWRGRGMADLQEGLQVSIPGWWNQLGGSGAPCCSCVA